MLGTFGLKLLKCLVFLGLFKNAEYYFEAVLTWYFPGGTEENNEETITVADIPFQF
jgi:hypothetical protein